MKIVAILFSAIVIALVIWVWRMVNWVWLRPRKLEKCFRKQGMNGHPYRTLYGDTKEMAEMTKEAKFKPIKLTDDILPRIFPFYHHTFNKYGNHCFAWIGPEPRIFVMKPELIKEIVTNNTIFKKPKPAPLVQLLVSGISSYEDDKWAKHRKILNTAFYAEKLKCMLPAMHTSCEDMINKWEILLSENKSCELDVHPYFEDFTSDVISRTAFGSSYAEGTRIFHLQKELAELTRQAFQSVYIPGWRYLPTRTNRRMKAIDNELRDILRKIVSKRERAMVGEASDQEDLLGILLKSNLKEIQERGSKFGMTTDEVIEECKVFYFAGQESSSNLLVWTMVLLSVHQTWQARAREEVQQVFQNNKPDFEGLSRLKIVTMILNEVLRLYPPAPYFVRKVYKETKLGNMSIPPEVILVIPTIFVHHNPELWGEDVKEFKPERFAEGIATATKNRLCFLPFSWGPRICIGNNFAMLETKIALAMILQRFAFELSPSYAHAPTYVVTLRPQCGAHLILQKL
ncbi:cytochrome P450 CYP72A219 [Nicotiana tabacum]|uniref:Cytochrome P450 CYP72A219 n=1 Tax=Nicotiana tabacum TaxID=4097 RepID=A0A1S3XJQ7_TOBAC|nr:cytochrome P450 CYP72A219-like [Nicotiana tomentosiformis]XP_016440148.1 PREDICTED: cytochrome P450 CYP72A219-like [Nicotiana tabacum]